MRLTTSRDDSGLDPKRIPRHIAIVMDGNGRWAKKQGLSRIKGHEKGAEAVRAVIEACRELGAVQSLTLYAFSTENWRRSKAEVSGLFRLLSKYIRLEVKNLHAEGIRVRFIGRRDGVAGNVVREMDESEALTRNNRAMQVNFAINYGARAELADAARAIAADVKAGRLKEDKIDEAAIAARLYDPISADLDLLIRTGGQERLSNFMLWQASYAEIYVTDTLWPDFRKRNLFDAFRDFAGRDRNFGGRPRA
jgi:undecaprenyl diphosphate synthase